MSKKLNVENPQFIYWEEKNIKFDVLGGIRLNGLDRLRVTLRVTFNNDVIRHNVDLYNDNQFSNIVRKCAERFEMSSSYLSPIIGQLTNLLEEYRINEIKSRTEKKDLKIQLSDEEKKEAIKLLKSKDLLSTINKLIGQAGVIGEVDNRLLMYIIFTSRLMSNPLHIISMGASGTGKSHLQESVAALLPDEDTLSVTDLSPSSFYYFEPHELAHKLILIEDLDGADKVLYPIRELQSKKYITKTFVEKTRQGLFTTKRTVNGPICVGGCTTRETIYEDNSNRSFLIYIDSSEKQDDLILEYQRSLSSGEVDFNERNKAIKLLQNAQRLLDSVRIINPYAKELVLPKSVFKPRRTNAHYLHFIEAVTFLNQFQREKKVDSKTGAIYIESTIEDIENANRLMLDVLIKKSDRLNRSTRKYLEELKVYLKKARKQKFTSFDTARKFDRSLKSIQRYHYTLVDHGYLKTSHEKGGRTLVYQIVDPKEYEKLEKGVSIALDNALKTIKQGKS